MIRSGSRLASIFLGLVFAATLVTTVRAEDPNDNDQTLHAMRDEMNRSKSRLELSIPGVDQPVKPYYIEYRLLDLDVREVVGDFGALLSSTHTRSRFMNVAARVGNYQRDSSNFVSDDGFRGFIGPQGSVGIDRDYNSLRQDLWIATDQAFKEAAETFSRKQAYLGTLARQTDIDDFSQAEPLHIVEPLVTPDWSARNWEQEARDTSAAMRLFPELYESRVTYYLVYATEYLVTSEGTEIRTNRSFASIEAALNTLAGDGVPLNHFYSTYSPRPADLPAVDKVRASLNVSATELMSLRASPSAQDYTGPVLFEARAAAPLIAQVLGPAVNGARPPISFSPVMEQLLTNLGGKSDWVTRIGARVLPTGVSLVDDPTLTTYEGQPLLGSYAVDEEGVRAQKVVLVKNGALKGELMSRRPGPDFGVSNGHGRAAFLSDALPTMSNLLFTSTETISPADNDFSMFLSPAEMKKKFADACRQEKLPYCIVVREMDNPSVSLLHQEEFQELLASFGGGAGTGDRLPLVVYRYYPDDGREELVRGARIIGLNARALRNISAFGSAQNGLPASVVAPSLLFDELEIRGARGEPQRLPLLPAPQITAAK